MSEDSKIDSILVVGGGDVGLLYALGLDKGVKSDVVVIDDFEEKVPKIGKSTLYTVVRYIRDSLEIDLQRLFKEVELAWKTTVYFKDWCGQGPFHSPLGSEIPIVGQRMKNALSPHKLTSASEDEFKEFYYRYITDNFSDMYTKIAETPGKTPLVIDEDDVFKVREGLPSVSYQFNSNSFNNFLRTICRERGIELINDRIDNVETNENEIKFVSSGRNEYKADLYIDATGFKRVLMNELENQFYEFDLPVDSAVVTTVTTPLSEIVSATVITSGDAGWFWQIDTGGTPMADRDLGYVYSSNHISEKDAENEFIDSIDEAICQSDLRNYQFESGVLKRAWIGNCIAVGNALGFVEPLQSTALSTSCLIARRLITLLAKNACLNHGGLRDVFNKTTLETWEEVYEFISIFYKYNSGSTQFWEDARLVNQEQSNLIQNYQKFGFSAWQYISHLKRSNLVLNESILYYLIFQGLGIESKFYENIDYSIDEEIRKLVEEHKSNLDKHVDEFISYEEYYNSFHPGFN